MYKMSRLKISKIYTYTNAVRRYTSDCNISGRRGLVLGVYDACESGEIRLTDAANKYDICVSGKLRELLKGSRIQRGKAQVFGGLNDDFSYIAVAGLGQEGLSYSTAESIDLCKENIREAAGAGAIALQDLGITNIFTEAFTNAEPAAEGSQLAVWKYTDWKTEGRQVIPKVEMYNSEDVQYWLKGTIATEAQNMSRWIAECPSNLMTPSLFTQLMIEYLCPCGIAVEVKCRDWMESNRFHGFLTMARGSCQQPMIAEIQYCGGKQNERPVVLTGKGATFDCGGMNLGDAKGMSIRRGDLAGAAAVVTVIKAAARLSLPINLTGILAVYENLASGLAVKQGDVVLSMSGKTIRVDDPSHDGRVVLSDCLTYSAKYKPAFVIAMSTANPGLSHSLGCPPNGLYTTSDICWKELKNAGAYTGDRVWRLPLFKCFRSRITNFEEVDVVNTGKGLGGGPSLAAAFLMEFCPMECDLVALDLSGTALKMTGGGMNYIRRGTMTGRPVRTVVQFLYQLACPHELNDDC